MKITSIKVEYDREYGIDKRRGWSIVLNGAYLVALEPWLVVAVWRAWRCYRLIDRGTL